MIALSVPDMSCAHCKARVEAAVASVDPGAKVSVDLDRRHVTVGATEGTDPILAALDAAGFPATLA